MGDEMKFLQRMLRIIVSSALLLTVGCSSVQPDFNATIPWYYSAVYEGRLREFLSNQEAAAREAERKAVESSSPRDYWEAAAVAYWHAIFAAQRIGQVHKTLLYAEKAMEAAEKSKDPVVKLRVADRLARAYRLVGNYDKAGEYLQRAFEILKEVPPTNDIRDICEACLYNTLGVHFARQHQSWKALEAHRKAVSLAGVYLSSVKADDRALEMARVLFLQTLSSLGNSYRRIGNPDAALEQFQEIFKSIREWGLKYPSESMVYGSIGNAYRQKWEFQKSLEGYRRALTLAEASKKSREASLWRVSIGSLLVRMGYPDEALLYIRKAIEQIESTRGLLESSEYRQSYFAGHVGIYMRAIGALVSAGKFEEAFNYSESARSRAFLDVLGTKVELSKTKSALFHQERELNEWISRLKSMLPGEAEEDVRASLKKELVEAEKAYSAFLDRVRQENKEQASLMSVEPLTLREVQELLDPGTTLVEYFFIRSKILIWVVERETFHFQQIRLSKRLIASLVKRLRESIYTLGEKEKLKEVSAFLYRDLIEPIIEHVGGKELIIVPHDVLHYLPFHALVLPDGKYLIEKYSIYYLSSASLLQFILEKRKAQVGRGRVLAFGNPDLGDPEKNLKFAEFEAREIQRIYPRSKVLLKKEATEEKGKVLSPQYDILHFATHAELNENEPLSSAILLANEGTEDGRLEVSEVFGMDLKANLVVLSGCETGLGKLSTGDELVGLARAFIYAGTPSVVASLWKVGDRSTAALMESFYQNLKTMSKVEALRQAQLKLIRGEGRSDLLARRGIRGIEKLSEIPQAKSPSSASVSTSHPFFWAPFILVGDGD